MDKVNENGSNILQFKARSLNAIKSASLATESRRVQNVMASGALATTLFLVTLFNASINEQNQLLKQAQSDAKSGRAIASVQISDKETAVSNWDSKVLSQLANKAERTLAGASGQASQLDQLRFGFLEGKYAVRLDDGKVTEINFQDGEKSSDRPKYLSSKDDFLIQYKDILNADFKTAARINESVVSGKITETYRLIGDSAKPVAMAEFVTDEYGRLLNFKVIRL